MNVKECGHFVSIRRESIIAEVAAFTILKQYQSRGRLQSFDWSFLGYRHSLADTITFFIGPRLVSHLLTPPISTPNMADGPDEKILPITWNEGGQSSILFGVRLFLANEVKGTDRTKRPQILPGDATMYVSGDNGQNPMNRVLAETLDA